MLVLGILSSLHILTCPNLSPVKVSFVSFAARSNNGLSFWQKQSLRLVLLSRWLPRLPSAASLTVPQAQPSSDALGLTSQWPHWLFSVYTAVQLEFSLASSGIKYPPGGSVRTNEMFPSKYFIIFDRNVSKMLQYWDASLPLRKC